jgi:hypothetical protein
MTDLTSQNAPAFRRLRPALIPRRVGRARAWAFVFEREFLSIIQNPPAREDPR